MGRIVPRAIATAAAVILAATEMAAAVEPFPVSLAPSAVSTEVDSVFTVVLQADSGAAHFNAYEITILFDPSVLDFEAVTEGTLMLSGCGNTFAFLTQTDSTVTYSHSLLCGGVSLDGPGPLSSYRFRGVANGISPIEIISSPDSSFFDAGLFISPMHPTRPRQVSFTSVTVIVGPDPTGSPSGSERPAGASIQMRPNPMRGDGEIHFALTRTGPATLEILDVTGRRVLARTWPALRPGVHRTPWSARDESGRPLPGGVYLVRLTDADGTRTTKATLVR